MGFHSESSWPSPGQAESTIAWNIQVNYVTCKWPVDQKSQESGAKRDKSAGPQIHQSCMTVQSQEMFWNKPENLVEGLFILWYWRNWLNSQGGSMEFFFLHFPVTDLLRLEPSTPSDRLIQSRNDSGRRLHLHVRMFIRRCRYEFLSHNTTLLLSAWSIALVNKSIPDRCWHNEPMISIASKL